MGAKKQYSAKEILERRRLSSRQWYAKNREKVLATRRGAEYRAVAVASRAKRFSNLTEAQRSNIAASKLKHKLSVPWMPLLGNAKHRAKVRGLPFNLTPEWAQSVYTGRCALTNIPFLIHRERSRGAHAFSPSIDRIRGEAGYVVDNCRFILHAVNAFRGTLRDEEMVELARWIVASAAEMPRVDLLAKFCNKGSASSDDLLLATRARAQRLLEKSA